MKLPTTYHLLLVVFLVVPLLSFAHQGHDVSAPSIFPSGYWGADGLVVRCGGSNPCDRNDLIHTFIHVIYFGMTLALFVAAPIFFAWGGILILMSGANPGGIEQGKKIVTGTVMGILIRFSSYLIVKTFVSFIGIQGVGGF